MTATTVTKAKETVRSTIADGLRHGFEQFAGHLSDRKGASAIAGISRDILEDLLSDPESSKALLSLLVISSAHQRQGDQWLKTEEAARRLGFSRPYVAALIDAGEFGADVSKSEKGHRRVKSSAIDQWLLEHRIGGSNEERKAPLLHADPAEFFELPRLSDKERDGLAKRIKDGRKESVKHRPARKRA